MGIERIKERILEEAQDEKDAILEEAKSRAQDIAAKSKKQAEEIKEAALERHKKIGEDEQRKILSISQLELRKSLLTEKQNMIDEAFERAKEKIKHLPLETYQKIVFNMLTSASVEGDEEILISEADRDKITPDLVEKANEALKKSGIKAKLRLSNTYREMIGGFVLKSKDVEINNSFDALIKFEREALETKIAKILFEE